MPGLHFNLFVLPDVLYELYLHPRKHPGDSQWGKLLFAESELNAAENGHILREVKKCGRPEPVVPVYHKTGHRNALNEFLLHALFLYPFVEPGVNLLVPKQGILWLEYPVVLFREDDKPARNSHHLGGIECCHTLLVRNAEVHHSVYAEYRGMPFRYHLAR